MAKDQNLNPATKKLSAGILDILDQDLAQNAAVFTDEKREALVKILADYAPEVHQYIKRLPRSDVSARFLQWILAMRTVEFKASEALGCAKRMSETLQNARFTKQTRDTLLEDLQELADWLNLI